MRIFVLSTAKNDTTHLKILQDRFSYQNRQPFSKGCIFFTSPDPPAGGEGG
jgi:hypothetical protein